MAAAGWSPTSWQGLPAKQQPKYEDAERVEAVLKQLASLPPLVTAPEVDRLRSQLADVAAGKAFLLQGGDCAERFLDCTSSKVEKKLKILLQMSLVLTWAARKKTVRIGRMAGQYAKPRSKDTEVVDGKTMSSFRGDNINSFEADEKSRRPDPERLLGGYFHAAAMINYIRGLCAPGHGFSDLNNMEEWSMDFVRNATRKLEYEGIVRQVQDALAFAKTCGGDAPSYHSIDMFTSHEGLHLPFEQAMTRRVAVHRAAATPAGAGAADSKGGDEGGRRPARHYNLGAHFLWIGDRTRQLDHAHVEYFRGIANPIGIKLGPSTPPDAVVPLLRKLWPDPAATPGKVTLITRLGAGRVRELLPPFIRAIQAAEPALPVVWCCDPMHGNTTKSKDDLKTRDLSNILQEIHDTFAVHAELGSALGGVHLEMTGENVTECTGGPQGLLEKDLPLRYTSYCDPRLNGAQSMEVAFVVAGHLRGKVADGTTKKDAR